MSPSEIIRRVLAEIDDANFHVCGGNWVRINDLVDHPGTYGTLADWVCIVASEDYALGPDSYDELAYRCPDLARGFLRLTVEEWESLEHVDLEHVRERLNNLLRLESEAA